MDAERCREEAGSTGAEEKPLESSPAKHARRPHAERPPPCPLLPWNKGIASRSRSCELLVAHAADTKHERPSAHRGAVSRAVMGTVGSQEAGMDAECSREEAGSTGAEPKPLKSSPAKHARRPHAERPPPCLLPPWNKGIASRRRSCELLVAHAADTKHGRPLARCDAAVHAVAMLAPVGEDGVEARRMPLDEVVTARRSTRSARWTPKAPR
jgi:hypothetical protein